MLYVCGTPIGNLGDVTPRLLDTLRRVDVIAAEDTRHTRKLLSHFDIHAPLTSYFRHNETQKSEELIRLLRAGKDVALVSDAGMPAVSDPGMGLIARAVAEDIVVCVVPGPSAVLTSLVAAGFKAASFCFVGYLPRRASELETALRGWQAYDGLVVAFETAPRLPRSLSVLARLLPEARLAVCREMTKAHEEVKRGSARELNEAYALVPQDGPGRLRGEITLVMDLGKTEAAPTSRAETEAAAAALLGRGLSRRDAASALQICLGMPHREADDLTRRVATGR